MYQPDGSSLVLVPEPRGVAMSEPGAPSEHAPVAADLAGSWRRSAGTESDLSYPDVLELTEVTPGTGKYVGHKGRQEQGFLRWDAGTWLVAAGQLQISTATDAIESWPITVAGDEMQIQVGQGVLTYRRNTGPEV